MKLSINKIHLELWKQVETTRKVEWAREGEGGGRGQEGE